MDEFDTINNLQQQFYYQGYQNAKNDEEILKNSEKKQNYASGLTTGKQLGLELGYYSGYIEELKKNLSEIEEYAKHSSKIDLLLSEVEAIILNFNSQAGPIDFDELPNTVLTLRNKFKTLLLSLGLKKPDFQFSQQKDKDSFDF